MSLLCRMACVVAVAMLLGTTSFALAQTRQIFFALKHCERQSLLVLKKAPDDMTIEELNARFAKRELHDDIRPSNDRDARGLIARQQISACMYNLGYAFAGWPDGRWPEGQYTLLP